MQIYTYQDVYMKKEDVLRKLNISGELKSIGVLQNGSVQVKVFIDKTSRDS